MNKVSYAFLLAGLVVGAHSRAEVEVTCVLNPMVFDAKGEPHVDLEGASEKLTFTEHRVRGETKETYLKAETVLTQNVHGTQYKVYLTAIKHKDPDLLRVISRIQTEQRGRGGPTADLLSPPLEQTSWFSRPEEFPEMPLTAITLSNFPNTKIYQRYMDESGSVRMSTTELRGKVLEDATKNPANYRNKLYSLDLQCMGRQ